MAARKTAASTATPTVDVDPKVKKLQRKRIQVRIKGVSPLISHKWSEKAKKEMRDKHAKVPRGPKDSRDTDKEFNDARYIDAQGRDCVLACGIKKAIVSAASFQDDVTKVLLRGAVFVEGEYLPIESDTPIKREDVVRVGMGSADLRYRPEYRNWSVTFNLEYDASIISKAQLLDAMERAGFSIGIFEWRPQKDGDFGRFRVEKVVELPD